VIASGSKPDATERMGFVELVEAVVPLLVQAAVAITSTTARAIVLRISVGPPYWLRPV
jgi:hypothetical protein